MTYCVRAYAKINLNLSVGPKKKGGGYHPVSTVCQTISYADDLYISEISKKELRLTCRDDGYPVNKENVLWRVYELLKSQLPCGFSVYVHKRIPIGAGLGGGSSQAAAFLCFLNHVYNLGYDQMGLVNLGIKVGSDVPFFVLGGQALVEGYGEHVLASDCFVDNPYFLLILPRFPLSTVAVYKAFDVLNLGDSFCSAKKLPFGVNDLLSPAQSVDPKLVEILSLCGDEGFHPYLSGSGSTLFLPFISMDDCYHAYVKLSKHPTFFSVLTCFSVDTGYKCL